MRKVVWTFVALAFGVTSAAAQNPVSDSLKESWNGIKRNIKESAEQMPEANYSFKPTPDVRTFGAVLAHVAGASYMLCAAARSEKPPFAEDYFEKNATTKTAIVKATNDAIAYCDEAFTSLTDATAGQMVAAPFGSGQVPRVNPLVGQIGHDNEHYGNLVTYFRIKGMVPPSSKR
jgi:DinB family protein